MNSPSPTGAASGGVLARGGGGICRRGSPHAAANSDGRGPLQKTFEERQEALLQKTSRHGATRASRVAAPTCREDEGGRDAGDGASASGTVLSRASGAPSVHPSIAGTVMSLGCSETTIGAGDDTGYWDFQHRKVEAKDLGHRCRECRQPFRAIGEPMTERRGARISTRYHAECFSGFADPRSQSRSSHHEGHLAGSQMEAAPSQKAGSKMRTSCHFEGGRVAGGVGGKLGLQMDMGHNSFGSKSSKGKPAPVPQRRPGDITEEQLARHNLQHGARSASLPKINEGGARTDLE